jgi:hypothetical protein
LVERTTKKCSWKLAVQLLNENSWRKKNGITTTKNNEYAVVLGDKISDPSSKTLLCGIWKTSTWRVVHHAMVGMV